MLCRNLRDRDLDVDLGLLEDELTRGRDALYLGLSVGRFGGLDGSNLVKVGRSDAKLTLRNRRSVDRGVSGDGGSRGHQERRSEEGEESEVGLHVLSSSVGGFGRANPAGPPDERLKSKGGANRAMKLLVIFAVWFVFVLRGADPGVSRSAGQPVRIRCSVRVRRCRSVSDLVDAIERRWAPRGGLPTMLQSVPIPQETRA